MPPIRLVHQGFFSALGETARLSGIRVLDATFLLDVVKTINDADDLPSGMIFAILFVKNGKKFFKFPKNMSHTAHAVTRSAVPKEYVVPCKGIDLHIACIVSKQTLGGFFSGISYQIKKESGDGVPIWKVAICAYLQQKVADTVIPREHPGYLNFRPSPI